MTLYLANISNRHHQFKSMAKKLGRLRKYWIQGYTTDVDSTRSNGLAMRNQAGSQLVTSIMPLTESITSTPATRENLGHGFSQELDPREGATVTTLGARTPAPQSLTFSSLSRYAFPRFFLLLVILSMVRVATQQWLSQMHVTHACVSNTWLLMCS